MGDTEWIEIKLLTGDWNTLNLDEFSICFWIYNTFYGQQQRYHNFEQQ